MKLGVQIKLKMILAVAIPFLLMVYVQIHNPIILVMAVVLVFINIANPFVLLPSVFVTSLSAEYFVTPSGAGLTPWIFMFFIVALLISTKPTEYRRGGKTLLFLVVLIIYNLISSAFSVTGDFGTFAMMLFFYFPIVFFMSIKWDVDEDFIYKTFSATCLLFSFFLIYSFLTGGMGIAEESEGDDRLTFGDINANRYAMLCAPVATVLIFSFFYNSNLIYRILMLFGAFLTIFIIILTGSRSALLAVGGGSVFAVWFFVLRHTNSKGKFAMIFVLAIAILIGLNILSKSNLLVLDRLDFSSVQETGGSGRMERAEFLFSNVFPSHPLFGIGLGGINEKAVSSGACHNIILDVIIQIGIVGFLLYWLFLLPPIIRCSKGLKWDRLKMLPLILFVTVFLNGMGEVIFLERHFWIIISLCVLFANNHPSIYGHKKHFLDMANNDNNKGPSIINNQNK